MNWKQFKQLVEKQGIVDNDEINYIDMGGNRLPRVKKLKSNNDFVIDNFTYSDISTEELEKILDKSIEEIKEILSQL